MTMISLSLRVQLLRPAQRMVPVISITQLGQIGQHELVEFSGHRCRHDENTRRNRKEESLTFSAQLLLVALQTQSLRRKLKSISNYLIKLHNLKTVKISPGLSVRL